MFGVDKVSVIVFVKNKDDVGKYYRLFLLMVGDQVTHSLLGGDHGGIETEKFVIRFYVGGLHMKGVRAHYVINMMQNAEWDSFCVLPITNIFHHIKDDPKWSELFND